MNTFKGGILMKKILFVGLFLPYVLFALDASDDFNPRLCSYYMMEEFPGAKAQKNCVIDDNLKELIKCRASSKMNIMKESNSLGMRHHPVYYYYSSYDVRIKKVLLEEVKNVINRHQGIMGVENTEASLLKYQESIAEHEWCYAPKFLKAFNDKSMNEYKMKSHHFISLYNARSNMLISKEKPKNKKILCGVYLEYMSSFIHANHTEFSSELNELYQKTKKECFPNYFVLEVSINVKMHKNIAMRKYKPGTRDTTRKGSFNSKGVFHINPQNNSVELRKVENDLIEQNTKNIQQEHFLGNKSYNIDVKQKKHRPAPGINISLSITGNKDKKIKITASPVKYPTKYYFTIDLDTLLEQGEYKGQTSSQKKASESVLSESLMRHIGMSVQTGSSGSCSIYINRANKADVEEFKLYDSE